MEGIKKVGERIKNLREERNYSQSYMAGKLNISQKAYSKLESSETKLSVDNLIKIAEILETTINDILETAGSTVYNNFSTHNGEGIVINKSISDKFSELYEKIISAKNDEILRLQKQNETLLKSVEILTTRSKSSANTAPN